MHLRWIRIPSTIAGALTLTFLFFKGSIDAEPERPDLVLWGLLLVFGAWMLVSLMQDLKDTWVWSNFVTCNMAQGIVQLLVSWALLGYATLLYWDQLRSEVPLLLAIFIAYFGVGIGGGVLTAAVVGPRRVSAVCALGGVALSAWIEGGFPTRLEVWKALFEFVEIENPLLHWGWTVFLGMCALYDRAGSVGDLFSDQ
jgi:hypothetical protein